MSDLDGPLGFLILPSSILPVAEAGLGGLDTLSIVLGCMVHLDGVHTTGVL